MPQHKSSRRKSSGDFDVITGPSGPGRPLPVAVPPPAVATPERQPEAVPLGSTTGQRGQA